MKSEIVRELVIGKKKFIIRDAEKLDGTRIISNGCKRLIIKNGWFRTIALEGDFDTITFINSRGTIVNSHFCCKKIIIMKGKNGIVNFVDSKISSLEEIHCNGGIINYQNPVNPLNISICLNIKRGKFELDTSDLICPTIVFWDNTGLYFEDHKRHFEYRNICYDKVVSIKCDNLLIKGKFEVSSFGSGDIILNGNKVSVEEIAGVNNDLSSFMK